MPERTATMRTLLLTTAVLLLSLPARAARPDPAEGVYHAAAQDYYRLKGDAARRRFRHQWLKVIQAFEAVAQRHPSSPRAKDALYTAGQLLTELSHISLLDEDLQRAVTDYQRVIELDPRHHLADDAALALGRIYSDRLEQPALARKVLGRALQLQPGGDQAKKLKALLAALPAAKPEPAPAQAAALAPGRARGSAALLEAIARVQGGGSPAPAAPVPAPAAAEEQVVVGRPEPLVTAGGRPVSSVPELASAPRVRRVVIDAGHGGHDTGAIGRGGLREKDVTLAIARKVAAQLSELGLEVILTRDDDRFIRLEDRARIANDAKGELFLSIHCNSAASRTLRGIETYTLNTASDRYSIRLAARENSSSERGISDLQFILADLTTKANTDASHRLAARVQGSLVSSLGSRYSGVKDLGQKEALFYVLLGARMPAILVETSFLSHPEEESRLGSRGYQEDVARAISDGVKEFLAGREALAKKD